MTNGIGGVVPIAESDDIAGGGGDLLGAVDGVAVDVEVAAGGADGDGDGGVEQEQGPEHRLAVEQGGHDVLPSGSGGCERD